MHLPTLTVPAKLVRRRDSSLLLNLGSKKKQSAFYQRMSDPGKSQPMTVNEECGRGNSGLPLIDFGGQPPILRQSSTTVLVVVKTLYFYLSFHLPTVSVLEFFNVSISLFQFSFFLFLFLPPTLNQSVCHEISQVIIHMD